MHEQNENHHAIDYIKESMVYVRYQDHVLYNRGEPALMKPQVREAVGWLVYECADYIIIAWDRDVHAQTERHRQR